MALIMPKNQYIRSGSEKEYGQQTKTPEGATETNLMRDQLKLEVIELLPISGKTEHNTNHPKRIAMKQE